MSQDQRGFTLIELLIVVAIIGILATLAIPNLIGAMDKSKQQTTVANIKQLSQAITTYMIENNTYPSTKNIDELAKVLEPNYIQKVPMTDGWKNALVVTSGGRHFTICSNGKDGAGVCEQESVGPISSFDDSITLVNGTFVSFPQGAQN